MTELIQEKCILDKDWIDNLTSYYDGVFDENDGYIDTPKAVAIKLSNGDEFCVEFHSGDTIYYINDIQIGCTGSSYMIRNISLAQFYEYTSNMNDIEKIFLLPMVKITLEEKDELAKVIKLILSTADLQGCKGWYTHDEQIRAELDNLRKALNEARSRGMSDVVNNKYPNINKVSELQPPKSTDAKVPKICQ